MHVYAGLNISNLATCLYLHGSGRNYLDCTKLVRNAILMLLLGTIQHLPSHFLTPRVVDVLCFANGGRLALQLMAAPGMAQPILIARPRAKGPWSMTS